MSAFFLFIITIILLAAFFPSILWVILWIFLGLLALSIILGILKLLVIGFVKILHFIAILVEKTGLFGKYDNSLMFDYSENTKFVGNLEPNLKPNKES